MYHQFTKENKENQTTILRFGILQLIIILEGGAIMWSPLDNDDYDRTDTNDSDGQTFYGYDDKEDNSTSWYDENGNLDWIEKR